MGMSAEFYTHTEVLTRMDRIREDLLEIAAATKGDPAVQHLVGQALNTLDEAHGLIWPEASAPPVW